MDTQHLQKQEKSTGNITKKVATGRLKDWDGDVGIKIKNKNLDYLLLYYASLLEFMHTNRKYCVFNPNQS